MCPLPNCTVRLFRQAGQLPKNPCDQKVKAALDLGAVDEAVDVAGVHGLSVFSSCSFTHYRNNPTTLLALMTNKTSVRSGKYLLVFNLLGRVHCRARIACGLLAPPPSFLEDKRSHRNYRPQQNELRKDKE